MGKGDELRSQKRKEPDIILGGSILASEFEEVSEPSESTSKAPLAGWARGNSCWRYSQFMKSVCLSAYLVMAGEEFGPGAARTIIYCIDLSISLAISGPRFLVSSQWKHGFPKSRAESRNSPIPGLLVFTQSSLREAKVFQRQSWTLEPSACDGAFFNNATRFKGNLSLVFIPEQNIC